MMKKIISTVLSMTLAFTLGTSALAASLPKTDSAEVTGTYEGTAPQTVYSVDIAWSELSFTYSAGSAGVWNTQTHRYDSAVEAGWEKDASGATVTGEITVTNHSNAGVLATASYAASEGFEEAGVAFGGENVSNNSLGLSTADNGLNGEAGTATTGVITVTPEGKLPDTANGATIGTITVTITAPVTVE